MSVWPQPLSPHATIVPSDLRARLWKPPAEIATTPDRPAGTVVWPPLVLSPQATTVPFDFKARLSKYPAEIAVTPDRPAGTVVSPDELSPQATTVPFDFRARLCPEPAATAVTPDRPAGTSAWPKLSVPPQATTTWFAGTAAATGAARGPAQTVRDPLSRNDAGATPRSRIMTRWEPDKPMCERTPDAREDFTGRAPLRFGRRCASRSGNSCEPHNVSRGMLGAV